jgi:hypothetical protein
MNSSDLKYTPEDADESMSELAEVSDNEPVIPGLLTNENALFVATSLIVRDALLQDLKGSNLSRAEVAAELSRMTGRDISQAMIDAYVTPTKQNHRFPAELLPAWVYVLQSTRVLAALCRQVGLSVATREDQDFAEFGRARLREEKLSRKLWARC